MDVEKRTVRPRPPAVGRPLVIAHRGASDEEPEHTLRAYRKAFHYGADGVECDVRLTADHHLVCVHDRRVNRTSNGAGVVSALELATLEEFDWASWKLARRPGDTESPESDPERGHLLRETYGYEGSERDVLATGVIEAAGLSGPAARMLLLAGLGAGLRGEDLRAVFTVGA